MAGTAAKIQNLGHAGITADQPNCEFGAILIIVQTQRSRSFPLEHLNDVTGLPKAPSRWSASHAFEAVHREENGRNGVHLHQKKMVRLIEHTADIHLSADDGNAQYGP
jgi:hypothetical protein